MKSNVIVLFLGLLFVLSVGSASAMDLDNLTENNVVDETIMVDHEVSINPDDQSVISGNNKTKREKEN